MIEPDLLTLADWTFRWHPSPKKNARLLVLLHGLTGDENSMWMLVQHLPATYSILAPRGRYPAEGTGYTWRAPDQAHDDLPVDADLLDSAEALMQFIDTWTAQQTLGSRQFDLMGFSQGTALAYLLTLLHPERVRKLAALSGFIPASTGGSHPLDGLKGKEVFVSHGRQDELIPVEHARTDVSALKQAGAKVTYCESDAGHKVNKDCLRAMEKFLG
jgi:phospholipase/carboxylesterase